MIVLLKFNPLSRPVAISEILLLLSFASFVGWLLAKLILKRRIDLLRKDVLQRAEEVEKCNESVLAFDEVGVFGVVSVKEDDLKLIEGIGPKIETLLKREGITSFYHLAITPTETVSGILQNAGPRFQLHDPATWREQADLANNGRWEELEELQNRLTGGRE